jgi:hypothetical protein
MSEGLIYIATSQKLSQKTLSKYNFSQRAPQPKDLWPAILF